MGQGLIPTYSLSEFRKLKAEQLKRLKSCEITSDGEYLFTFFNAQTDFLRVHAEYQAELSNSVKGESIEQITEQPILAVNKI